MTLKRGPRSRVIQDKPKWTKTNTFGNYKTEQNEQIKQQKLKICTPSIQELRDLHKALGHCGIHALFTWGQLRTIDLSWTKCKQAVENCPDCPMTVQRFRYKAPPELYKPNCFNAIIQIDFIGPLQTHKGDYACTMVDVHSGVMLAKAHKRPYAMAIIYTLWCWWARYGPGPLLSQIKARILLAK
jgi:hypothetical protein